MQRDFLRFAGQQILKELRNNNQDLLLEFFVGLKDRKYQVWKRNSLSTELWNESVFVQKLEYIHHNPVRAKLCELPENYYFWSARFYLNGKNEFDFLEHYKG